MDKKFETAGRTVALWKDGQSITNLELQHTLEVLPLVVKFLSSVGDRYYLPKSDLLQVLNQLEDAQQSRKR